jgi:hypothetical protein
VGEGKLKSFLKKLFSGGSGSCCCCGPGIVGSRDVSIDGLIVGIRGLDETFLKYRDDGKTADDLTGYELLETLDKMNRIDESKREAYRGALLREFRRYCEGQKER